MVIDATALATRHAPSGWTVLWRAVDAVPARARSIAAPLDEFLSVQCLCAFLDEARIDLLLTAIEPALWDSLYPPEGRTYAIRRILTAYIDEPLVRVARRVSPDLARRSIAVSYRAWQAPAWLGEMGVLKREVGVRAAAWAQALDRAHELKALSPRHLEAAATRTFQVLVEGDYSGVLQASVHYQRVRRDLCAIEAALDLSRDPIRAQAMVDRAYDEIVASGRYSWRRAVGDIVAQVLA